MDMDKYQSMKVEEELDKGGLKKYESRLTEG